VFRVTDEYRGGVDFDDWDFGLVRRDRTPKPAFVAVRDAFAAGVDDRDWPRMSVVICTYNGARTLRECLEGVTRLDYPDFEVIVVIDGSTDQSAKIASEFPFRIVHCQKNGGLSNARNIGMHEATGEIVAYLDDDAYPDPLWLRRLAIAFERSDPRASGPEPAAARRWLLAECRELAGQPAHVMLDDESWSTLRAQHGIQARCPLAIDGFDVVYRRRVTTWTCVGAGSGLDHRFRPGGIRPAPSPRLDQGLWRQQCGYGEAGRCSRWSPGATTTRDASWAGVYGRGQRWVRPRPLVHAGTWVLRCFRRSTGRAGHARGVVVHAGVASRVAVAAGLLAARAVVVAAVRVRAAVRSGSGSIRRTGSEGFAARVRHVPPRNEPLAVDGVGRDHGIPASDATARAALRSHSLPQRRGAPPEPPAVRLAAAAQRRRVVRVLAESGAAPAGAASAAEPRWPPGQGRWWLR
jgi:hypothetical protein